jgi:hypothetical protein
MLVYSPWRFGVECGYRNVANASPHNTAFIPEDLHIYFRHSEELLPHALLLATWHHYCTFPFCVADTFDPCSVCPGRNLNHSSIVSYWSVWQTIELYAVCHFIQYDHDHRDLSRLILSRTVAFPIHQLTVVYMCFVTFILKKYIFEMFFSRGIWRQVCQSF